MNIATVLIIVLVLIMVGFFPGAWPHSQNLGWGPSGGIGLVVLILLILLLAGKI